MKKIFIILTIIIISFVWVLFFSQAAQERYIKKEIIKANYCTVTSDCQMVQESQCPFGCYIYVNKDEITRIENLLENYKNRRYGHSCVYGCIEFTGVECINNTCDIKN